MPSSRSTRRRRARGWCARSRRSRARNAERHRPAEAGLFHTAFLLPSRADLADWLLRAARTGARLDGASDHLVSEALYLTDPEGNGIEIYRDRPSEEWPLDAAGLIGMATRRLA